VLYFTILLAVVVVVVVVVDVVVAPLISCLSRHLNVNSAANRSKYAHRICQIYIFLPA